MVHVRSTAEAASGTPARSEIVILDPAVERSEELVARLRPGVELHRLAPTGGGVRQIIAALAGRRDLGALHVVCHGDAGVLLLAGERVDLKALAAQADALRELSGHLADGATVLIYGCSVAAGVAGRMFLGYLEAALGVTVAASPAPVGAAARGGNWSLCRRDGTFPRLAFTVDVRAAYPGLLATATLTTGADAPALSGGSDTVTAGAGTLNAVDSIDGLTGADTLAVSGAQTVTFGAATLVNVETVTVAAGAQSITTHDATVASGQTLTVDASTSVDALAWTGSAETDGRFVLIGGGADDTLIGGSGADTLSGNVGDDHLSGGAGDDVIAYNGEPGYGDVIDGGTGIDTIRVTGSVDFLGVGSIAGIEVVSVSGGAGATFVDTFHGATISLSGAGAFQFMVWHSTSLDLSGLNTASLGTGATVTLGAGDNDDTTLIGPGDFGATLLAAGGDDLLRGGSQADRLTAGAGDDTLSGGGGDDHLSGGDGDDVLNGGLGADELSGNAGHDVLRGNGGWDFLTGGTGNDTLSGGTGSDLLLGGDDDDLLSGGDGDDDLCGEDGDDVLRGGAGEDWLCGEAGNDTLSGGAASDLLIGGAGSDALYGGAGDDTLSGGTGDDTLVGGAGNDVFVANDGNILLDWASGDEVILTGAAGLTVGGIGRSGSVLTFDTDGDSAVDVTLTTAGIPAAATFAVSVDAGHAHVTYSVPSSGGGGGGGGAPPTDPSPIVVVDAPSATGSTRTITNTGSASGSAAIVENTGNNGNVVTATLPAGTSVIAEGPGTAQSGGEALTTLVAAIEARDPAGPGALVSNVQNYLSSLSATTTLDVRTILPSTASSTLTEPIVITGTAPGAGVTQSEAFVIDVHGLPAGSTIQIDNIEFASIIGSATVIGGAGDNYAVGDGSAQFLSLGVGDDTLHGGAGDDTVGSGDGADCLFGDGGNDSVFGGAGADSVAGGADQDVIYGNQGDDVLYGNTGLDTLYGGQDDDVQYGGQHGDVLYGNLGDDVLYGNLGDDVLYGNLGGDTLFGGQGGDVLFGGQGADALFGNLGDDTLAGGRGDDVLHGGAGADLFVIGADAGNDTIADFSGAAGDRLAIAADTGVDTLPELIALVATAADGSVQFEIGGQVLVLSGVAPGDLQSGWFMFG